jgi:hypothetical protein
VSHIEDPPLRGESQSRNDRVARGKPLEVVGRDVSEVSAQGSAAEQSPRRFQPQSGPEPLDTKRTRKPDTKV